MGKKRARVQDMKAEGLRGLRRETLINSYIGVITYYLVCVSKDPYRNERSPEKYLMSR